MTEEEIKAYITATHTYLTVGEMVEDLAPLPVHKVGYYCRLLGIQPIKVKQRNINFILENHTKMSVAKIARLLGISEANLINTYGKELNIRFIMEEKREEQKPEAKDEVKDKREDVRSPGAILSNYRMGEAGHYHAPQAEKSEVDEAFREFFRRLKKSNL